jgi:hypothetical protein
LSRHEDSRQKLLEEAVLRYSQYVELAAGFLVARYGLTEETASDFKLGVVEDPLPMHSGYAGRLCLPYLDAGGTPRALKFRCLHDYDCKPEGCVKYLCTEASEPRLFNVRSLCNDQATTLYVTEGEFDTIVLTQLGLTAVGYPGTGNWKSIFTRAISPHDWDRVVVLADGDEAGRAAAKKVAKELRAEVILMPPGEDVASTYVKRGRDGLLEVLGLVPADAGDSGYPLEPPF